jgi:hypothetical protein
MDDYEDIHPDLLNQFYGVDHHPTRQTSGAGNPPDESEDEYESDADDGSWTDAEEEISETIQHNFHHEPVAVPRQSDPFKTQEGHQRFRELLSSYANHGYIPPGYHMRAEEWGDEGYPPYEAIRSGRRTTRFLDISLPDETWRPRAILWVQALDSMNQISNWEDNGMMTH